MTDWSMIIASVTASSIPGRPRTLATLARVSLSISCSVSTKRDGNLSFALETNGERDFVIFSAASQSISAYSLYDAET